MFTALVEGGNKYLRNPGQNSVTAPQQRQQGEQDAKGRRGEARRCKGPFSGLWSFITRAEFEVLITFTFLQAPSDGRVVRIECLVQSSEATTLAPGRDDWGFSWDGAVVRL